MGADARFEDWLIGAAGEGVLETEIASVTPTSGGWLWGAAALGGRHLIRSGQRVEVSLVEDVSVLRAKTEETIGPAGDHDVSVGRARLGLEVRGVCATGAGTVGRIRAFARRDWGDGIEGPGAEVAMGARLDAPERRVMARFEARR